MDLVVLKNAWETEDFFMTLDKKYGNKKNATFSLWDRKT